MIATRKLMEEIRKKTTNNSAGTTVLSQPLIREEDGNTYVYTYSLHEGEYGKVSRVDAHGNVL